MTPRQAKTRVEQLTREIEDRQARRVRALRLAGCAILVLIAAAAIAYRLRSSNFQWNRFAAAFRGLSWFWFAFSIFLNFGTYFGRALRWEVMIRPMKPNARVRTVLDATLIGFTSVLLLGRPGELVRPYLIANKEHLPFTSQMAAWLLERIFDLLMVLAVFSFALTRIPAAAIAAHPTLAHVLSTAGALSGILAVICFALLFVFGRFPGQAAARLSGALGILPERLREKVDRLVSTFLLGMQSTSQRGTLALLAAYTIAEWAVIVGTTWAVFRAFPETAGLGLNGICIFLGFVAFGSIVQIPGIGGGMQVAGVMALTEILGLDVEPATAIALIFWFVTFVTVVPVGLGLAVHEGVNWRRLRHLRDEV